MIRRPRKCCRCGVEPREPDGDGYLYLCSGCRVDPKTTDEIGVAIGEEHPRLFLIQQRGWSGGWTRQRD